MSDYLSKEERDLLIELRTDMKSVKADIRELKDNTTKRVDILEREKLDKQEADRLLRESEKIHNDFERRLRILERYSWLAIGAIGLVELVGAVYLIEKL